jgi:hypothetical protein
MHNIARTFVARWLIVLLLLGFPVSRWPPTPPLQFPTEQQAQEHCPTDTIVWLNLPNERDTLAVEDEARLQLARRKMVVHFVEPANVLKRRHADEGVVIPFIHRRRLSLIGMA